MFGLLAQIAKIQTEQIGELPTRLEKDKMKEYAKLDARYNVSLFNLLLYVYQLNEHERTVTTFEINF